MAVGGVFEEAIELRWIGERAHGEAAHLCEYGMSVEELDEPGDRFDLFEMFDDAGTEEGMSRIASASDARVEVGQAGQIEGGEEGVVFAVKVRGGEKGVIVVEQRALNISHDFSSRVVVTESVSITYSIPHLEEIARQITP